MNVQSRLSEYVDNMGIKQAKISEKTGIRRETIHAILKCKKKMTADEFELICRAIEKTPNDFMLTDKGDSE